jgi:hypothetical protein
MDSLQVKQTHTQLKPRPINLDGTFYDSVLCLRAPINGHAPKLTQTNTRMTITLCLNCTRVVVTNRKSSPTVARQTKRIPHLERAQTRSIRSLARDLINDGVNEFGKNLFF